MANNQISTEQFVENYNRVLGEVSKVFVGQTDVVSDLLKTVLAGGHSLLEGVPGLGKTLLVRTLARVFSLSFNRIQFTPDLMPADIIGTDIIFEDEHGKKARQFQPGPIFAHIVLADEINRATPKTQSALLQAMQEHMVTVSGNTYLLNEPFFVLATQNPIEMEGTYPLPEAQIDRFLTKIFISYPSQQELLTILDQTTGAHDPQINPVLNAEQILSMRDLIREVPIAEPIKELVGKLVMATHPQNSLAPDIVKKYVRYGSSPRGGQALIMTSKVTALVTNRFAVSRDDLLKNLKIALRHRIILSFEGEAEGIDRDSILDQVFSHVSK